MSDRESGVATVVLAGGASRRMGSEKALLAAAGMTLIERHLRALAPSFDEIVVSVCHGGPSPALADAVARASRSTAREIVLVEDGAADRGPLEGLRSSLARIRAERAFVLAVDMPPVDLVLVARLLGRLCPPHSRAVLPRSEHGPEPLHAVYRKALLPDIARLLAEGRRAVRAVVDLPGVETVAVAASEADRFASLNTPSDYARWLATSGLREDAETPLRRPPLSH